MIDQNEEQETGERQLAHIKQIEKPVVIPFAPDGGG